MSKATRKALALGSAAALGAASLVGLPAQAANANTVELTLTSGANWSVFNGDTISVDVATPTLLADAVVNANFAIVIDNAGSDNIDIDFTGVDADGANAYTFDILLIDADGTTNTDATVAAAEGTAETLDFVTNSDVKAILYNFVDTDGGGAGVDLDVAPASISITDNDGHGDDGKSVTLQAWIDSNADVTDVDAGTAADAETITFIDPATVNVRMNVVRAVADGATYLNEAGDAGFAATVRFSKVVNLDQITWANWEFDATTGGVAIVADQAQDASANADLFDGFTDHDSYGAYLTTFDVAATLAAGESYGLKANYTGVAAQNSSIGTFQVVEASDADITDIELPVTDGANLLDNGVGAVDLRPGTSSLTVSAQVLDVGGNAVATANQPVVVTVTAVEGTVSVQGVSGSAEAGESLLWNTSTNSDGQVDIVLTSSAAVGDSFVLEAYAMLNDGTSAASTQAQTFTYTAAAIDSWELNTEVASGANVLLTASIADQYGEAISVDTEGDDIYVGFLATDADDLDEYVAVVDGSASVSFANYVADGDSDNIVVSAHTGAEDDRVNLAGTLANLDVTLYATFEVAGVTTTSASVDAVVGYSDFGDDVTAADGTAGTVNGNVVDSVGAGIPGASVTVTGAGLQFTDGTNWAVGSLTLSADEAGAFTFDVYTHVADDATVTITSGGKSTEVTVAGALNNGGGAGASLSAANLLMSWNLAETVMYNTTYRVDATVTDVWGNPIANAEVTFAGEAAAQFNSDASVAKTTSAKGVATAYLRSLADVSGLAAVSLTLSNNIDFDGDLANDVTDVGDTFADDADTSWDESAAPEVIEAEINFLTSAPAAEAPAADTKVNAGSFKGYVAIYAKGHMGKRLSAKVGKDWVVVGSLDSNFERVVEYTGAGYTIAVRIYIDRVLVDTITVVTK